jgi:hypothetical protein
MHLITLTLRRAGYSSSADKPFEGTAQFAGSHGEINLHLKAAASRRLLAAVAQELVIASQETAQMLTHDALESTADSLALPAPVPPAPAPSIPDDDGAPF